MSDLITEDWLKSVGFKWHEFDRQGTKHWLLWLGSCLECDLPSRFSSYEDLGIELAFGAYNGLNVPQSWNCWFRGDTAGRYHRFIHVRHLSTQEQVIRLVEALTGLPWNPENHFYGEVRCQRCADRVRKDRERTDLRERERRAKWSEVEKDDTRGRALPEHMQAAIDGGKAT